VSKTKEKNGKLEYMEKEKGEKRRKKGKEDLGKRVSKYGKKV